MNEGSSYAEYLAKVWEQEERDRARFTGVEPAEVVYDMRDGRPVDLRTDREIHVWSAQDMEAMAAAIGALWRQIGGALAPMIQAMDDLSDRYAPARPRPRRVTVRHSYQKPRGEWWRR